jgi:SAM-dependent methyltransferase
VTLLLSRDRMPRLFGYPGEVPVMPIWMRAADRLRRALTPIRPIRTGTAAYDEHIEQERAHYRELYEGPQADRERLMEPSTQVWDDIHARAAGRIRAKSGEEMDGHIVSRLRGISNPRLLSLGCGPGGVELAIAREARHARLLGLDVNEQLLELGRASAAAEGLSVEFAAADLNQADLPHAEFDIVFCHASLHHILELERLFAGIKKALKPGGELIVMDVMTRNGYLMWPETKQLARAIFATLPERLRVNHTAYPQKYADSEIWERDTRKAGMECVRSEDIVPLLRNHFEERVFVPLLSLCRRFFDSMYGPNYNLDRPLDSAIVEWIWQLDCDSLDTGRLRPETFFGIYG